MIRSAILLALIATTPVLAGCFSATAELPIEPLSANVDRFVGYTWAAPVSHMADGAPVELPFAFEELPVGVEQLVPGAGAEPNVGVTSSGTIFVTTYDQVRRSRDHGATWEEVFDFTTPQYPKTVDVFATSDPMLWVDPVTDRVYANHMHPGLICTYMAWSDDEGDTWTERPFACGAIPGIDHQKVMTAPPAMGLPMPAYPNVLYICNNKRFDTMIQTGVSMGTSCMMSYDGGMTYPVETEAYVTDEVCSNVNGHPAAYPDGTVVFIMGALGGEDCERPATAVLSETNGLTWTPRQCAPDVQNKEIDADVTVTPDGTAYALIRDETHKMRLLRTTDKFVSCDVFDVSPPDNTLNVFAGITSGDDGRIAMVYLGTKDPQQPGATPSNATGGTRWHAFVTTSFDAASENPTFVTQQVTPHEDPVQVGCVWLGGGGGGYEICRNLRDFIDMTVDPDGRWVAAITDGCTPRNGCTGTPEQTDFQSGDEQVAIIIQDKGMSLFADQGLVQPLGMSPPQPLRR